MRALVVIFISISLLSAGSVGSASIKPKILPFKTWKQKKIDEAKSVVLELKHEHKSESGEDPQEQAQKLSQAELNLGLMKELSANDYFLLYVTPQFKGNNEALTMAAKTLSPHDMADILSAYQKKLQSNDSVNETEELQSEKTAKAP